jgi:hypothetical protein
MQHTHYISAYLLDCFIELILSTGDKNIGTFLDEPLCGKLNPSSSKQCTGS